ncbi:MAG: EthD domain-containing protein [Sphingomonadales bacterium]|nr:EthD domain-containing protein [Sphingomonadales bacterium]
MLKQLCFFRKRPDMTMEQFMDYYENEHCKLAAKLGSPAIPNAVRYVRRYLEPVKNPITGEVHDSGYDCLMEIWWNSREDFERSQALIANPERLPHTKADEANLFATHANPICLVTEESDSPMGPNGEMIDWVPVVRSEG